MPHDSGPARRPRRQPASTSFPHRIAVDSSRSGLVWLFAVFFGAVIVLHGWFTGFLLSASGDGGRLPMALSR